jgi:hypothetical protein
MTDYDKAWNSKYITSRMFDFIPVFQDNKNTKSLNVKAISRVISPEKNPT